MAQQFDLNKEMARSTGIGPQVVALAGTVDGTVFYPMSEFHTGVLLGQATLAEADTAVFVLLSAEDAIGTNAAATTILFTLTGGTGGSVEIGSIGFDQHDIPYPGHLFVGARCVLDGDANTISAAILRSDPRYSYNGVANHA